MLINCLFYRTIHELFCEVSCHRLIVNFVDFHYIVISPCIANLFEICIYVDLSSSKCNVSVVGAKVYRTNTLL
ncbi:uncharacterized protein DS421_16g554690 [Arachis hypogaea]|nr:uncharacterized protein DS421_16g554690 [Arachis hypogaea]